MGAAARSPETRKIVVRAAAGLAAPLVIAGLLGLFAPAETYLWIKAGHLVAAMGWMGGMLGVAYLFAFHAQTVPGSPDAERLTDIERQAMRLIVNPAMVLTWGVGLWLAWQGRWLSDGWLHAKLLVVTILSGMHGWAVGTVRSFASGERQRGARFYARIAAMGGLLAAAAVTLVIVKPM